ncbi:MAG TPA: sugar ABC transporter permease, partial [Ruminococcaceae bacterium]|nr:sugar ABC transporter permease [Oscillospiraceae bacterium]
MLETITLLISITFMYSAPLIFGALGGVTSERAGVVNIGIEGMMNIGAFVGTAVCFYSGNPWLGFLMAGLAGGLLALLHAVASVTFKADQTISGIALNLIGPGFSLFLCRMFFDGATMSKPIANKLPKIFGNIKTGSTAVKNLNLDITAVLAAALAVILWFVLYKTKWGLRVRAVGEHPAAADSLGISVT